LLLAHHDIGKLGAVPEGSGRTLSTVRRTGGPEPLGRWKTRKENRMKRAGHDVVTAVVPDATTVAMGRLLATIGVVALSVALLAMAGCAGFQAYYSLPDDQRRAIRAAQGQEEVSRAARKYNHEH